MATKKKAVELEVTNVAAALRATGAEVLVGLIVHWVNMQDIHRPAIVVDVVDQAAGRCNLQVFVSPVDGFHADQGTQWVEFARYSEEPLCGTWHFIES